jgi:hypothetical protein
MMRSGRAHGFVPRRGCPCTAERADRGFVDQNGAGDAGQSDGPTQAEAMPVEIRRGWPVSLRWRIGGDGIMRCFDLLSRFAQRSMSAITAPGRVRPVSPAGQACVYFYF